MQEVKFVNISDEYSDYLAAFFETPGSMGRGHTYKRMYVQFPYLLNGHVYCIPLSSPRAKDYVKDRHGNLLLRPDSYHDFKLLGTNNITKKREVKCSVRADRMIPVPQSEIIYLDMEDCTFSSNYKILLDKQYRCILSIFDTFINYVVNLYNMKTGAIPTDEFFESVERCIPALDFRRLEDYCTKFKSCVEKGIRKEDILDYVMLSLSEAAGARSRELPGSSEEQPGCSTWGVSSSRHGEDEYRYSDSPDGGRKRKRRESRSEEDSSSVRRRVSESRGESSRTSQGRSYTSKGKGKGRSRRIPTR